MNTVRSYESLFLRQINSFRFKHMRILACVLRAANPSLKTGCPVHKRSSWGILPECFNSRHEDRKAGLQFGTCETVERAGREAEGRFVLESITQSRKLAGKRRPFTIRIFLASSMPPSASRSLGRCRRAVFAVGDSSMTRNTSGLVFH